MFYQYLALSTSKESTEEHGTTFFCYRRKIFIFFLFFSSLFFPPYDVLWLFKILQAVNKYLQLKRRISLNECSYNLVFPYVLEFVFDICIFGIRAGLWTGLLRI